jgi:hypothetical protein
MGPRIRSLAAGLLAVAPLVLPVVAAPLQSQGDPDRPARVAATFRDDRIAESSGLAVRGGVVLTVNDSGDGPYVYEVDPRTGRTTRVVTYDDEDPDDVEALAPGGDGALWVGDIGDNRRWRDSIRVHRLVLGSGGGLFSASAFDLVYPDGPHDAETLLVRPRTGRLLVVTKSWVSGGVVYEAPRHLRTGETHRLRRVATVPGLITDGAFLPAGDRVLLRTYGTAGLYTYPGFKRLAEVELPWQDQGEGIAVEGRSVYLSSEGESSEVLAVDLGSFERAARSQAARSARPEASPSARPETRSPEGERASDGQDEGPQPWMGLGPGGYVLVVLAAGASVVVVRGALRRSRRRR